MRWGAAVAGKQRLVDGPDNDLLEMEEVAAYLRLGLRTLRRLIDAGDFPRPIMISDGTKVWDWKDCLYWKLRSEMRPRLRPGRKRPAVDKAGPNPGQPGTSGKRAKPDA